MTEPKNPPPGRVVYSCAICNRPTVVERWASRVVVLDGQPVVIKKAVICGSHELPAEAWMEDRS